MKTDVWDSLRPGEYLVPNEWLQQPYETNKDLIELAIRYHRETEAYDKTVCTGPVVDGVIYPSNSKERGLININAKKTRKLIEQEAAAKNIDRKELMHEIRRMGVTGAWQRYQVES
jgi:hypothetical protein